MTELSYFCAIAGKVAGLAAAFSHLGSQLSV